LVIAALASAAAFVGALSTATEAGAKPLPPDDGAPPEDVVAVPGGAIVEPEQPSDPTIRVTADVERFSPLPETPPVSNTFPIAGQSRNTCANSFGAPRSGGRTHMGDDCFAPIGTPLVAVETGVIRYATAQIAPYNCATGSGDLSGNRVSVRGRSGYVYYYGHLNTILVATDQLVQKGQVIGTVGRTGNAMCSSPHVHFEVKCGENGDPFDPWPWLGTWSRSPSPDSSPPSTSGMGVGVVISSLKRQDLVTLECGQAMRLMTWQASSGLSPGWQIVDGMASSDPDVASAGDPTTLRVVARGMDNAAWILRWDGAVWSAQSLGGICSSAPSVAYTGSDRLDVFCRGLDNALWQRVWTASEGWGAGWHRLGGIAASDPDAVSPGPAYPVQLFALGTDKAVWQVWWDGTRWQFENRGGFCTSGPTATYSGPDRLDVFCRGADLALIHRSWRRDTGWSAGWQRIESAILSDPEATSSGPGGFPQVFARGLDRRVYQVLWDGSNWVVWSVWGVT
jgi:hypothetical protein